MPGPCSKPKDGKTAVCNKNGKNARHLANQNEKRAANQAMAAGAFKKEKR